MQKEGEEKTEIGPTRNEVEQNEANSMLFDTVVLVFVWFSLHFSWGFFPSAWLNQRIDFVNKEHGIWLVAYRSIRLVNVWSRWWTLNFAWIDDSDEGKANDSFPVIPSFVCFTLYFALIFVFFDSLRMGLLLAIRDMQVEVCRSQHTQTWLGSLYIYKGLLLVVGVYMAWETRHVKVRFFHKLFGYFLCFFYHLNDSKLSALFSRYQPWMTLNISVFLFMVLS